MDENAVYYDVVCAHSVSKSCFICGTENRSGLHAQFIETAQGHLIGIVVPSEDHQSYPGRMHGGISSAVLDEVIGRAINITEPATWGVTVSLEVIYRKPLPLDKPLIARAVITQSSDRLYEGIGEIVLSDGTIAVQAYGRYFKMKLEKISDVDMHSAEEIVIDTRPLPEKFMFPTKTGFEITELRRR